MKPLLGSELKLPEDGFYNVCRKGEFPIDFMVDGEKVELVQVIDDVSLASFVSRMAEKRKDPSFAGVLVDQDHFSREAARPSAAYGWNFDLQNRDGEIFAKIDWTNTGLPDIQGGTYKFASIDVDPNVEGAVEFLDDKRVRLLDITRIAVTNDPRIPNLKPFTQAVLNSFRNRAGQGATPDKENSPGVQPGKDGGQSVDYKVLLLQNLGLPPTATDQEIQAACDASKGETMQSRKTEIDTLKNRVTALTTSLVETDLEQHKDVIEDKEAAKAMLLLNREVGLKMLNGLKKPAPAAGPTFRNRDASRPAAEGAAAEDVDDQTSAKIASRATELLNSKTCRSRADAFRRARKEIVGAAKK